MKRLPTAIAAIALIATPAFAADMARKMPVKAPPPPPPAPVSSWTGCYVGGNVGGGWAEKSFTERAGSVAPGAFDGSHTANGWLGGGQVGCDYQFATSWVVGVRGMWDGGSLTGSNLSADPLFLNNFTWHTKIDSVATVVGEFGYVDPTFKVYGLAGIGWVRDHFTCDGPGCVPSTSVDGNRSGFDLGVGFAWRFLPNWDLFLEYDHIWLGNKTLFFNEAGGPFTSFNESINQNLNKILFGIDYRFNWGP